jgi:transposase
MNEVITIGVDLAKNVFQVHGVDASGQVVVRRQLRRRQVLPFFEKQAACVIGLEACATAHHWAREIAKLGHDVRLMPARYVKPYVKRNKNDAADAEAICEAVTRPTMRFVAVKTKEQQSVLMLHRTRQLFVRQRTTLINAIRAHLAEFGTLLLGSAATAWRGSFGSSTTGPTSVCLLWHGNAFKRCGPNSCWSNGRSWRLTGASLPGTGRMN